MEKSIGTAEIKTQTCRSNPASEPSYKTTEYTLTTTIWEITKKRLKLLTKRREKTTLVKLVCQITQFKTIIEQA